ncbi:hypothetical protein BDR03DRAFT_145275 [Suillus americanus]|nr:hypothetical protein BDR03DRAFT_145275 [Suillus americanus]
MKLFIIDHLAAIIIFEHSFHIFDKQRYLQNQQESVPPLDIALERYIASPHATAVREAVSAAVQTYQAAKTAAYTYKGKSPAQMAKSLFERFQQKDKKYLAKAELINAILEITLNHRLPRP